MGAGALVRMRTPDGRILAPGHVIAAAGETGPVVPLGAPVLASAPGRTRELLQAAGGYAAG